MHDKDKFLSVAFCGISPVEVFSTLLEDDMLCRNAAELLTDRFKPDPPLLYCCTFTRDWLKLPRDLVKLSRDWVKLSRD